MDLKNKNIIVIGLARSGLAAIKLLNDLGIIVKAYDSKSKDFFEKELKNLDDKNKYYFGKFPINILDEIDLIIISPGVPTDLVFLNVAKQMGIPIWSELEFAYRFYKGKLIAITGTNGKTTTTTLVGEIMNTYYNEVFVVGNIGLPFSEIVLKTTENSVVVAEVSSFQLETINSFKPDISCILNITPDHLNRHKTMENYINAKKRITEFQSQTDICILNVDDINTSKLINSLITNNYKFSRIKRLDKGVYLEKNIIKFSEDGRNYTICDINELQVLGAHNIENIMASIAIAINMGIPLHLIKKAVTSFRGVEHRIEYVTTINNIKFYNDSKATNPDAAIKGIKAMVRPTVLIAGGMDKGNEFDDWFLAFDNRVTYLIVFGETKYIIKETASKYKFQNIIVVNDLKEAVAKSFLLANSGDC
ncbi:MAG: UDP-N-acetylmuramoyl-L-alanine--D-glutamate ligase, partial [Eubacteriales bacterium]